MTELLSRIDALQRGPPMARLYTRFLWRLCHLRKSPSELRNRRFRGTTFKDQNSLMSQNKLYVGNLSFNSTEGDITDAFSAHGTVTSVNVITDRETGRPRGFAFVEMSSDAEAQSAMQALDGQDLDGRTLKVNIAKPRENRGGGGGGRRDRW
jgi:RNA recognition motif-containing protein